MEFTRMLTMLCALVGAVPALAQAQTAEFVHGAICNPRPGDVGKLDYNEWGIFNMSPTTAVTVCHVGYTNKLAPVQITVYDRNTGTDVCCTVRVQAEDGATRWSSQRRCTSGFSDAPKVIAAGTPTAGGIISAVCEIPARSSGPLDKSIVSSFRFTK